MSKPLIGMVALVNNHTQSCGTISKCLDVVVQAGGLPTLVPMTGKEELFYQAVEMCDGFIIAGEDDLIMDREEKNGYVLPDSQQNARVIFVLDTAIKVNKPLLSISTGLQFLNAALGGTLFRDIRVQSFSANQQTLSEHPPVHNVSINPDTPLAKLLKIRQLSVKGNRFQGIEKISPILKSMAYASNGSIEAVYMPLKAFMWGILWHPELAYMTDDNSKKIIDLFIAHATMQRNSLL